MHPIRFTKTGERDLTLERQLQKDKTVPIKAIKANNIPAFQDQSTSIVHGGLKQQATIPLSKI
nr:hypothetical protein [Turicimonas muris]